LMSLRISNARVFALMDLGHEMAVRYLGWRRRWHGLPSSMVFPPDGSLAKLSAVLAPNMAWRVGLPLPVREFLIGSPCTTTNGSTTLKGESLRFPFANTRRRSPPKCVLVENPWCRTVTYPLFFGSRMTFAPPLVDMVSANAAASSK
jgi:hypothetical protein